MNPIETLESITTIKTVKMFRCPFCGNRAGLNHRSYLGYYVCCDSCGTCGPQSKSYDEPQKGIEAWNRRQPCGVNVKLIMDYFRGLIESVGNNKEKQHAWLSGAKEVLKENETRFELSE